MIRQGGDALMGWKVSEVAKMTDGVGFTIQQPGKAEIVAFVFKDEQTAARLGHFVLLPPATRARTCLRQADFRCEPQPAFTGLPPLGRCSPWRHPVRRPTRMARLPSG